MAGKSSGGGGKGGGGGNSGGANERHRSAESGRFVTERYADKHPRTTVTERVKPPKK